MSDIQQKNNTVNGDLAARDINKITNIYGNGPSLMSCLVSKFKEEWKNSVEFHDKVEELERYCISGDDGVKVVGLEVKLMDGGFDSYIEYARSTKEKFYKKLVKFQFYESAQEIFALVLADIYTRYHNQILPMIKEGANKTKIHQAIQDEIVDPVAKLLEENVLRILADEINGALYFLTGNCHVKWV